MAKIRKALVGAAGAGLAVVADALAKGTPVNWAVVVGAAAAAFVAVWSVPNQGA